MFLYDSDRNIFKIKTLELGGGRHSSPRPVRDVVFLTRRTEAQTMQLEAQMRISNAPTICAKKKKKNR
jgi:hypothetical protein